MINRIYVAAAAVVLLGACSSRESTDVTVDADSDSARTFPDRNPRCIGNDPRDPCSLYSVSVIELIARPELYDGRRVLVTAFASLAFEANGLYISESDANAGIARNGIWMDPPPATAVGSADFLWNRRYVIVEGTFHASVGGHMNAWSGEISDVARYQAFSGGPGRDEERRDPASG